MDSSPSPQPWPGAEGAASTDTQSEPPPPTGPAYPGTPPPSAAQSSSLGSPAFPPKRRKRGGLVAGIVIAVVVLVGLAVLVGDWLARNIEMNDLVSGIETSEAAMIEAMDEVRVALREDDPGQGLEPATGAELQQIAADALDEVSAAAATIESVNIQPWHDDVILARDVYLQHNGAWQDFLQAASEDPDQWFVQYEPIETTWNAVDPVLRAAVPSPALWDIDTRVDAILDDAEETQSGPALDASA